MNRIKDILVVILCLSGAVFSLNLFRQDLNQTIASQNLEPVGTVTIKYNNVQRRLSDRVLWGRLAAESPVYLGDLIRVAELSSATLNIADNSIDLNENTLIRILFSPEEEGRIMLDLSTGSLDIVAVSSIDLNLSGSGRVEATAGTVLSAAAGETGMLLQVIEGSAEITTDDGQSRSVSTGEQFALDAGGVEYREPAAVVTQPRPNARFLKNNPELFNINFTWNTTNIDAEQHQNTLLLLEIAADRNFLQITHRIEGANSAVASLDAGFWHWRLSFENKILSTGQLTVVNAAGASPVSPVQGSQFEFLVNQQQDQQDSSSLPAVRFEWQEVEEASFYIIEAGLTADLNSPQMRRQTVATSLIDYSLSDGTWYWRVLPVFTSVYEGSAAYSNTASFNIVFIEPKPEVVPEPQPPVQEPEIIVEAEPEPVSVPTPTPTPAPQRPAAPQLLPETARANRLPADGHRLRIEDLRGTRRIDFSWSPVLEANAYIFTLIHQGTSGRRQLVRTDPLVNTSWTLDNLALLDYGTFIWQVEAVILSRDGSIERRGRVAETRFIIDIPAPTLPQIDDMEIKHD